MDIKALTAQSHEIRAKYNRNLKAKGRPLLKTPPPVETLTLHALAREIRERLIGSRKKNSKLGALYSWSLLAIATCLYRTVACSGEPGGKIPCYAAGIQNRRPAVWLAWFRCVELALHPLFAEALALALASLPAGILRVHVSGDFFSVAYLEAWLDAVERNPHVRPFAFTRSWRGLDFRAALEERGYPSWILASTDADTGKAPVEMREAAMAEETKSAVLSGKIAAPALACPEQTGKADDCATCGRCPMARLTETGIKLTPSAARVGVRFLIH